MLERWALRELLQQPVEIRGIFAPRELRMAQIEIGEGYPGRDIRQRIGLSVAPRLVAEIAAHRLDGHVHSALVSIKRLGTLLPLRTQRFEPRADRGIHQSVAERLPALDQDALTRRFWNQATHRTNQVDVLDDDARIEEIGAVLEHEHRHLAERIMIADDAVVRPRILLDQRVFDLFFGERDAHFASVRTGLRCEEFHYGVRDASADYSNAPALLRAGRRTQG